jgi:hypothetical protein
MLTNALIGTRSLAAASDALLHRFSRGSVALRRNRARVSEGSREPTGGSGVSNSIANIVVGAVTVMLFGLASCGGSSGSGSMSLSVADAPVDGAEKVVVEFTGVELIPNTGNPVTITFESPKTIDLLNDSGTASAQLFSQPIPAGSYGQIRLMVVADGNPSNSYIMLSDGTMHGLQVPSGSETGL